MSSIIILVLVLGYTIVVDRITYLQCNVFERTGSEPAVLVNAASLLYIREVGSSNPTRGISKLLSFSFFCFLLFSLLQISSFLVFYKQFISFVKK